MTALWSWIIENFNNREISSTIVRCRGAFKIRRGFAVCPLRVTFGLSARLWRLFRHGKKHQTPPL